MTLTEFLLARIAEDEAIARATTAHIAHWDPARGILATCTAKRRLLALHGHVSRDGYGPSGRCDDYPCPTLQLLAMPYADHPDYDPSWQR